MTVKILVTGVGGQGTITSIKLICQAAKLEGHKVIAREIHGMAQRGGSVNASVVIGGSSSAMIGKGDADLVIATEPLELLRNMHLISRKSVAVVCMDKVIPFSIRGNESDYPTTDSLIRTIISNAGSLFYINEANIYSMHQFKKSLNIYILGVAVRSGALPVSRDSFIRVINEYFKPDVASINLKLFESGYALEMVDTISQNKDDFEYLNPANYEYLLEQETMTG